MGYAHYIDQRGLEAGYGVDAVCEQPGCDEVINRGLAYRCGDDDNEAGCHGFFCYGHLVYIVQDGRLVSSQLCPSCADSGDKETR